MNIPEAEIEAATIALCDDTRLSPRYCRDLVRVVLEAAAAVREAQMKQFADAMKRADELPK